MVQILGDFIIQIRLIFSAPEGAFCFTAWAMLTAMLGIIAAMRFERWAEETGRIIEDV